MFIFRERDGERERERGRESEHEQGRGRERGRDRESQAGSTPSAQSPTQGSNSRYCEIMTLQCLFFFNFFNVLFVFETDRDSMNGGGAEREETQNRKQAPVSELSAQSPARGSNSQSCEVMT